MFLLLADSEPLGRLDPAFMGQQALMESTVAQLAEISLEDFSDENGNFLDITEWYGVICDSKANVTEITWENLQGSMVAIDR